MTAGPRGGATAVMGTPAAAKPPGPPNKKVVEVGKNDFSSMVLQVAFSRKVCTISTSSNIQTRSAFGDRLADYLPVGGPQWGGGIVGVCVCVGGGGCVCVHCTPSTSAVVYYHSIGNRRRSRRRTAQTTKLVLVPVHPPGLHQLTEKLYVSTFGGVEGDRGSPFTASLSTTLYIKHQGIKVPVAGGLLRSRDRVTRPALAPALSCGAFFTPDGTTPVQRSILSGPHVHSPYTATPAA
jgi:hypothetical protein